MSVKPFLLAAKIMVSVGLVVWLASSDQFHLPHLNWAMAAPALTAIVGACLIALCLQGMRWWLLIRIHGISIGFWQAARMYWVSQFYAIFLPGAVGGDLVRGYYIFKHAPQTRVAGVISIILDRVAGLLAFIALGVVAFIASSLTGDLPPALVRMGWLASILLVGAVIGLFLAHSIGGKIAARMPTRWRSEAIGLVEALQAHKAGLAGAFGLSLISATAMMAAFLAAAIAIGAPGSLHILMATPAVIVANNLPISLGGLGVGEAAAAVLFGQIGIAEGAAIMILVRAGLLIWRLAGAALLLLPAPRPMEASYAAE